MQTQPTNNLVESGLDLQNSTNQQLKKRNTVLIPDFPNLQFDILNNSRVVWCVSSTGRHLLLQKFIATRRDKLRLQNYNLDTVSFDF